jgi:hypothetical protein
MSTSTRFNDYLTSHFRSCRLISKAYDEHRKRNVGLHLIPGHWDVIGVTDEHESWIAPVNASCFGVNVQRLLDDFREGKPFPGHDSVPVPVRTRNAIPRDIVAEVVARAPTPTGRRKIEAPPPLHELPRRRPT